MSRAKGIAHAEVEFEVKPEVAFEGQSLNSVECDSLYRLDYYKSTVMHAQLDELCVRFKIPHAILMRVSRGDESP